MSDSVGMYQSRENLSACNTNIQVDRVFVKAISTIRALSSRSNYGSLPRPPAESRIKLYGLYKQATEGDVRGLCLVLWVSPLKMKEQKKWDAWKREEGLPKQRRRNDILPFDRNYESICQWYT